MSCKISQSKPWEDSYITLRFINIYEYFTFFGRRTWGCHRFTTISNSRGLDFTTPPLISMKLGLKDGWTRERWVCGRMVVRADSRGWSEYRIIDDGTLFKRKKRPLIVMDRDLHLWVFLALWQINMLVPRLHLQYRNLAKLFLAFISNSLSFFSSESWFQFLYCLVFPRGRDDEKIPKWKDVKKKVWEYMKICEWGNEYMAGWQNGKTWRVGRREKCEDRWIGKTCAKQGLGHAVRLRTQIIYCSAL